MDVARLSQIVTPWASGLNYRIRIYFFGSRLKGTHRPDSDLDLAIEFLDPCVNSETIWYDLEDPWTKELSSLTGLNVRPQVLNENSEPLNTYVKECFAVIFEATPEPGSDELRLAGFPGFSENIGSSSNSKERAKKRGKLELPRFRGRLTA
jgi:predicted nucleotidyltransferase